jgi:predicted PurR-regulated permease PerM
MSSVDRSTIFRYTISTLFWLGFLALFFPFYSEILLGAVFAFAIEPFLGRLLQRRHLRWRFSVAVILFLMFVALAVPISVVGYKAYAYVVQISKLGLQNTPGFQKLLLFKSEVIGFAGHFLSRFGLSDQIDLAGMGEDSLSRAANWSMALLSGLATQIPSILLSLFVFCSSLYFFLAEASPLKTIFLRQRVLTLPQTDRLIAVMQKSSYNTVITTVLIAIMQGTLLGVASWVFSTGDPAVVWVVTFFSAFVPLISAGPVALLLGAANLMTGEYGYAIGFVVVSVLASAIDHGVRPYLISSGEDDLHPIVSLLALIGGLLIFGVSGLFLGPVIASVAVKIVPTVFGEPEPPITASGKKGRA